MQSQIHSTFCLKDKFCQLILNPSYRITSKAPGVGLEPRSSSSGFIKLSTILSKDIIIFS
ncbi:MAG: hypothetical protein QOK90_10355 [Nitrososphaeraceae archaeon]|nr:hypothetical protein [Nitrososphaeraceae archaeon]